MALGQSETLQAVLIRELVSQGLPLDRATIRVDELRARKSKIWRLDEKIWQTRAQDLPDWYPRALAVQARAPLWDGARRPERIHPHGNAPACKIAT